MLFWNEDTVAPQLIQEGEAEWKEEDLGFSFLAFVGASDALSCPALPRVLSSLLILLWVKRRVWGNLSQVVERRASQVLGSEANSLISSRCFPSSPSIMHMTGSPLGLLAVVMDVTDIED